LSAFFDTSVLIPVFMEDHEHHERSLKAFLRADKRRDACAAHSLAEVYATMTRLPGRQRLSGEQALLFLENICERLRLVSLSGDEYYEAVKKASEIGIAGGTIYDLLIARCALKAKAEAIFTWNTNHFELFGDAIRARLKTP
jgi:predicted nucleic acid-binding protein